MRRSTVQFLILLVLGLAACAGDPRRQMTITAQQSADQRTIGEFYQAWFESVEAGDAEATLSLLHRDFVIKGPLGSPVSDPKKLLDALVRMHMAVGQEIEWKLEESSVHGDWAWARVTEVATHIPKSGGAPIIYRGSHLSVLRRSQGRWKLYRDQGSLDELPTSS
jgi:ketosteroid isomerase-like protein